MMKNNIFLLFILATGLMGRAQDTPAPQSGFLEGHPDDYLPSYIQKICGFGERPEWSHDGTHILFVDKPMGEVYETGTVNRDHQSQNPPF